ncbi:hypothetical protein Taro_036744 [Colocasia esculenta]|uniref:SBP-type domain-containing protein n=1 Tax=Colocasia esculenta TaxID=4460 RepID=A0A843W3W6_COLES|nr:hypothetical protein [Colocasia esculenta]
MELRSFRGCCLSGFCCLLHTVDDFRLMLTIHLALEWSSDEILLHCKRSAGTKFLRDSMLLFDTSHKMESWIYGSKGKASMISDEMLPPINSFVSPKDMLTGWELRNAIDYHSLTQIPSPELTKDEGLVELRFHGSSKVISSEKPMRGSVYENVSHGRMVNSCLFSQKAPFQKQESGSKDSSSITDINEHDSSFIDLKLGRLVDFKAVKNNKCPKDTQSSSVTSTVPAKKIRSTCLNGQTPFCQVYGCNMDLSSSKDYHKRHKVCEIHSKTAKVIVNGAEQRFCQQCSRFHLLAEFDDGKRSCRKRLAGHNERRRKPQLDIHSRTGNLFQTYHDTGGNFMDTSLPVMASFLCSDIFPSEIVHEARYGNGEIPSSGLSSMSAATGQLFPKSLLPRHNTEKQFSSTYNVGNASGNMLLHAMLIMNINDQGVLLAARTWPEGNCPLFEKLSSG